MSLIDNLEADGFDLKTLLDPKASQEVARVMQICNACRYCEGFCAVFPAMTRRRHFNEGDVGYLSNLCHNCGACYHACQYAPPHEFGVNVPQAFAAARSLVGVFQLTRLTEPLTSEACVPLRSQFLGVFVQGSGGDTQQFLVVEALPAPPVIDDVTLRTRPVSLACRARHAVFAMIWKGDFTKRCGLKSF